MKLVAGASAVLWLVAVAADSSYIIASERTRLWEFSMEVPVLEHC